MMVSKAARYRVTLLQQQQHQTLRGVQEVGILTSEEFQSKSHAQLPTRETTITGIMTTGIMVTMVTIVVAVHIIMVVVVIMKDNISKIICMVCLEHSIQVMAIAICVVSMLFTIYM